MSQKSGDTPNETQEIKETEESETSSLEKFLLRFGVIGELMVLFYWANAGGWLPWFFYLVC